MVNHMALSNTGFYAGSPCVQSAVSFALILAPFFELLVRFTALKILFL